MPEPAAAPVRQRATVKAVLSGDTIVVRGEPRGGPPKETTICLSGVAAPRLAKYMSAAASANNASNQDEPWAWQSREYLRKLLVGKPVTFTSEHKTSTGREYGNIYLNDTTDIMRVMVRDGWVKLRDNRKGGEDAEELKQLAQTAQDSQYGVYQDEQHPDAVRNVKWTQANPRTIVDKYKMQPLDAIIEQVRDGCTVRAFILPTFEYVTVMLSGIKTPGFKRSETPGGEDVPERFAAESKFFVECRLLQREVKIVLEGVAGNNNNYCGTVLHPAGNIAEFLLKDGYAKIVDWSMANVSTGRDKYRAAEKAAKAAKVRVWQDYNPASANAIAITEKQIKGVVVEIVNPETLVVRTADGSTRRVSLASVRQPRTQQTPGSAAAQSGGRGAARPLYSIPFYLDAREFLRKKLIGQKVTVEVDYIQAAQANYPEKICGTVLFGQINIGEALVGKGLATVTRHRGDDDQRSAHYDDLLVAESRAQKKGNGIHSKGESAAPKVIEITTRAVGDRFLGPIKRNGRTQAVVEYVTGASRLRIYVPRDSCAGTLVLAGISAPRTGGRGGEASEPFADEGLALTKAACLHHDVTIDIEDMDKNGAFVGHVTLPDGKNLGEELLAQGLASCHRSAENYKNFNVYTRAEESAQAAKKNLWAGYVKPSEADISAAAASSAVAEKKPRTVNYEDVVVTEVVSPTSVYVQAAATADDLTAMMVELAAHFGGTAANNGAVAFKKGDVIAAKFSLDNGWYRARVTAASKDSLEVLYVDYGNSETVLRANTAALPAGTPTTLPHQAREVAFALVTPAPEDYVEDAVNAVEDTMLNRPFKMNVEYQEGSTPCVTLVDPETQEDMIESIVSCGLLFVQKRRMDYHLKELAATYTAAQQRAKDDHMGAFQYGDISGDDAKEFGHKVVVRA